MAGLGGKITEVAQDLGLTVAVADLPADHEGPLVPAPGPAGLTHRAVRRGDGAESRALGLPVADLAGQLHRLPGAGQDVLRPGQPGVGLGQVDQGEALHVLVSGFPGGGQDPLEAVEAEVELAQLQVGAAEVDHGVDVLTPSVAGLAADVTRLGVAAEGVGELAEAGVRMAEAVQRRNSVSTNPGATIVWAVGESGVSGSFNPLAMETSG